MARSVKKGPYIDPKLMKKIEAMNRSGDKRVIIIDGEVVGAINIGYGTPPRDEATLRALAERFEIPFDEIQAAAQAYKPRPQFIIDVAKRRCRSVARMIGDAAS